ncbi:LamG-like jellyroll fold domain-containing protein [Streptosporangium sp. NPDC004379]|uniref:LamG-like jellyroll fold domain-containing protein n=1 Tax=Streptosporangium sp. NPDC004379 TaxID=3366189 RepID=UPI0036A1F101
MLAVIISGRFSLSLAGRSISQLTEVSVSASSPHHLSAPPPRRRRSKRTGTAVLTVSALAASLLVAAVPQTAQADPRPDAAVAPAKPSVTTFPRPADPDAALRAGVEEARKQNKPVEVEAAGTETSRSWANPDGTITMQAYSGPTRVKQPDGSWAWVDTTLVERDGALKPKIGKADVAFSMGGDGKAFASMGRGGKEQRFTLDWPTPLPRPEVNGNVARYVDAAGPGADLVVAALPTGFQHDVVLRERPKGPVEIRIPVRNDGLRLTEAKRGRLELADSKGKLVAHAPAPIMWDSTEPGADGQGNRRTGSIDTQVLEKDGTATLVLKPDAGFLADPATKYPVVVDPTTTLTLDTDTFVASTGTGYDNPGAPRLKVGGESVRDSSSAPSVVRFHNALIKFDTTPLIGKAVGSAQLELWAPKASRCDHWTSGLRVSRITAPWTPGELTWANQPSVAQAGSQIQLCPPYDPDADPYPRAFSWAVTPIASSWAGGSPNYGLQISTVDETTPWGGVGSIEFHSAETTGTGARPPKLTVSYMLPPEIPTVTAESIDSMDGNDAIARSTKVKVGFKSSVAEGTNLDYTVSVNDSTMGTPPTIPTGETAYWKFDEASGTTATDSSGKGFPATLKGAASRDTGQLGKALKLVNDIYTDPSDAYAVTAKPVLNTNQSFSVSAWARLDGSAGDHTVVSQAGNQQSGFFLSYHEYEQKWWFGMPRSDAVPAQVTIVASKDPAPINVWTHLVAVYDATTQKLRLYVDGTLSGEKDHLTPWNARGNFQIGRTKMDGSFTDYLNGGIDDVHVYNRVLTESDVRALHGVPTATSYNGIPSGQVVDKLFTLDNPASFKFVVKACRTGVTPPSCNESPAYRITSDAPFIPTDAETGMADPTRPILSGMVNRPSGGPVTAKYFLYDSTGAPVGTSPLGERTVNGGERASFQVPENTVQLGRTYTWQMQTCVEEVCTAKTASVSFTVPGTPPELPAEDVRHLTLLKDNFVIKTTKTDPTACDGNPCPLIDSPIMRIGGAGTDKTVSVIRLRLDELPNGAGVSEALLNLGSPDCMTSTCPVDGVITAIPLKSQTNNDTKGSDLAADIDSSTAATALPLNSPKGDIAGSEYSWLMLTSNKEEIVTFGDVPAERQPSLALTYLPAGPPGSVLNLVAQAGDASAIASWGLPESNGSVAILDGYDVEVADSGGGIVKTLEVKEPYAAISGLSNGQTFTVRVRAKTAFGVSGWEETTVTPKFVPPPPPPSQKASCSMSSNTFSGHVGATTDSESGAAVYIDRVKNYYQAQEAVLEGRADTIWDASGVTPDAPSAASLSLLNERLVQQRGAMERVGESRTDSTTVLKDTVISAGSDGSVRVTTNVDRTWKIQGASPLGSSTAAAEEGQVDPSDFTISVFVFDRCGDITVIEVPYDANEDSSDFSDDEGWNCGGAQRGAAVTQACSGASGSAPGSLISEGFDKTLNLGKSWVVHYRFGSSTPRTVHDALDPWDSEWPIESFVNYVRIYPYPRNISENKNYGWSSSYGKYLVSHAYMKVTGATCLRSSKGGFEVGVTISMDPQLNLKWGGRKGQEECGSVSEERKRGSRENAGDPQINAYRGLTWGKCKNAECSIDRFRHDYRAEIRLDFKKNDTWYRNYLIGADKSCQITRSSGLLSSSVSYSMGGCIGKSSVEDVGPPL